MAYPYDDPLQQITGFAGGNLADQLRRRRPQPQQWLPSPAAVPSSTQPSIPNEYMDMGKVQLPAPPKSPSPSDAYNMDTSGTPQPLRDVGGAGGDIPQAPGLNSVGRKLELIQKIKQQRAQQPVETRDDIVNPSGFFPPGYPTEPPPHMRLSNMASEGAQLREQGRAPLNTPVTTDEYGLPVVGETKPLSKKHAILMGILQGALAGGAQAGWKGALGGAATGGIAGAVNPKLIYALERKQEMDRLQGKYDQDVANRAKQQQLGLQQSQTAENLAQAQRASIGTPHYQIDRNGNIQAIYDNRSTPVVDAKTGQPTLAKDPDAITPYQQAQLDEAHKFHADTIAARRAALDRADKRAREAASRKQLHIDPTTGDYVSFDPATQRVTTIRKGSKGAQNAAKANALYTAASSQYEDAKHRYDEADKLRDEADKLAPEGDFGAAYINKDKIKALLKRADALEKEGDGIATKVRAMQVEGDKMMADSEAVGATQRPPRQSRPAGQASPGSGRRRGQRPVGKYAGQRISSANLPEAAKRLGMSEADARAYIAREGGTIY